MVAILEPPSGKAIWGSIHPRFFLLPALTRRSFLATSSPTEDGAAEAVRQRSGNGPVIEQGGARMEPYVGEIRIFGGTFAPEGWLFCDGTILSIDGMETLFQLIGTTYGGDGQTTFGLPDLRGRVPVGVGGSGVPGYLLATAGGTETVTLSTPQMPAHGHPWPTGSGSQTQPDGAYLAPAAGVAGAQGYSTASPGTSLNPQSVSVVGSSQPHNNVQPSLGLNFIICFWGIYPTFN